MKTLYWLIVMRGTYIQPITQFLSCRFFMLRKSSHLVWTAGRDDGSAPCHSLTTFLVNTIAIN